ncbi:hypothetical protein PtA15_4A35 [Puccinia triticina]|uniref:Uncharacterized protein n=1 Tax=Puccinia triticina TaxID=208348 RepID=A0ABY7CGK0_9BASI|nr:uncharacterized protein PtA15_4A35 [Puccinia triticina]WAQ83587.1 hypothetical protein PtA15_4A35 [Puccinia triticina]WAR54434.1 hypothetical protein PtB15_4B51 [Puccinia triticina]
METESLSSSDCQKLVDYINATSGETSWVTSSNFASLSMSEKLNVAPLSSKCELHGQITHKDVSFSMWKSNPNNSIISVDTSFPKLLHFARIETIFTHVRKTTNGEHITDTWLKVKPLPPIPVTTSDVFANLNHPHLQLHLRLPAINDEYMIKSTDIVSHCAWLEYSASELVSEIDYPVVALVSVDRE